MNRHALEVLELPAALDLVSGYASSPLGADAVRSLTPFDATEPIEAELGRVEQMVNLLLRDEDRAMPAIPDLRRQLRGLGVDGSVWDAGDLAAAGVLLASAREARRSILRVAEGVPLLADIAEGLLTLEREEEAIRRAIEPQRGELRDDASRELARLRRELRRARSRIVERLDRFVAGLTDRIRVADASVSIRDGRYVIPIRREGRSEVGGIVHDESSTGATLFVEPPIAIELMNRLRELELAEAREVQRILLRLTELLRPHRDGLEDSLTRLVTLDSLFARARYALRTNGRRPTIGDAGRTELRIVGGAHPLLLAGPDPVVPFDLELVDGERTLLVSGPNTGGKTVLLKAIGLIAALTQSGIIPPLGPGSRLPIFADVFADIGDEQSIEASLSTFSAHLRNLKEVLERADHRSLVLIDEIGSGTDPAEGAALARAILVELTRRSALTLATTHLGDLKRLAGEEEGVVNASLQFDSVQLRPTFRLVKGVPGRSYGLAIAARLGFPPALVRDAEGLLPRDERKAAQLLRDLEEREHAAARERRALEVERRRTEEIRRDYERKLADVSEREADSERRARQQARDHLLAAREEVEEAIGALRARIDALSTGPAAATSAGSDAARLEFEEAARQARRRVEGAAARQAERMPPPGDRTGDRAGDRRDGDPEAAALRPGRRVRIRASGAIGRVLELRDGRVVVESGGVRFHVRAGDVESLSGEEEPDSVAAVETSASSWGGSDVDPTAEVDLRGLRAEEALGRLQPALDAAIVGDLPGLRIIHGKGTGALREVVEEALGRDARIRSYRPGRLGEGGAGVTVVEFR